MVLDKIDVAEGLEQLIVICIGSQVATVEGIRMVWIWDSRYVPCGFHGEATIL